MLCSLKAESWQDAAATLPEGVKAFCDGSLVGVVAATEELAEQAATKLQRLLRWDVQALPACREGGVDLFEIAPSIDSQVFHEAGQMPVASKNAKVYEAEYFRPALHHGSIGPSVAVAIWESAAVHSGLKVWSHTQGIFPLRQDLALAFGVDAQQVEVQHMRGAGCYGHNGADDVAYDAAWLAQQVPGSCVRVQWTREEEMQHSPMAPAMRVRLQATVQVNKDAKLNSQVAESSGIQFLTWQAVVSLQGQSSKPGLMSRRVFTAHGDKEKNIYVALALRRR